LVGFNNVNRKNVFMILIYQCQKWKEQVKISNQRHLKFTSEFLKYWICYGECMVNFTWRAGLALHLLWDTQTLFNFLWF
jgi:hypothetical protein